MVKKGYRLYLDTTGKICSPVNNEGDPESLRNGGQKVYQVSLVGRHPSRKAPIILFCLTCTTTNTETIHKWWILLASRYKKQYGEDLRPAVIMTDHGFVELDFLSRTLNLKKWTD
jgi:hypothetical protein